MESCRSTFPLQRQRPAGARASKSFRTTRPDMYANHVMFSFRTTRATPKKTITRSCSAASLPRARSNVARSCQCLRHEKAGPDAPCGLPSARGGSSVTSRKAHHPKRESGGRQRIPPHTTVQGPEFNQSGAEHLIASRAVRCPLLFRVPRSRYNPDEIHRSDAQPSHASNN